VLLVEPDAVRVDAQVEAADGFDRGAHSASDLGKPGHTDKQRLPAVQNDPYVRQAMLSGVLRDASGRLSDRLRSNKRRATAPTLIGMFVDIAMIARQVTTAMHLENELPEGQGTPGYSHDLR
jgi:hypothetical protein